VVVLTQENDFIGLRILEKAQGDKDKQKQNSMEFLY